MRRDVQDPFSAVRLGPATLRNRVIKAATSEGRSSDGMVTDELIAFHRTFAEGGVGMTTVAYCCVSREGASAPGQIVMTRQALPGLRRLTDAVHSAGAAASAQLGHAGVVAPKKLTGVTAVAPSRFINPTSFAYCREITRDEIRIVIDQFGAAAQVAVDAGFDAVEMGSYPYTDLYMLEAARQFVPVMRNTKLILLGGITNHDHVQTGLREGFDFVAMGRALLREPDLVNKMIADPATRSRCTHNNKCMVTVFGRTHCVLDPQRRYGTVPTNAPEAVALPVAES